MSVSAYQTKKGRLFKAILYMEGKTVCSKRGFLTKKDARRWMLEEENRRTEKTPAGTNFGFVANAYLDDMQARRQPNTYSYKMGTINRLLGYLGGDFTFESFGQHAMDDYLLKQRKERGSVAANRDCKELSILWNWAIRKNYIQSNPWRAMEPFPTESFQRYVPSAEDIAKVRLAATPEEREWLDALYFTGARLGEIIKLRWADVSLEQRTITLYTRKRRGGNLEGRTMGMSKGLHRLLSAKHSTRTASPLVFPNEQGTACHRNGNFLRNLFKRVCRRAGVQRFTAHCIRHFVATKLKDSKQATSYQIQHFLGHKNHRTTETYLHELAVDHEVVDILDDTPTPKTPCTATHKAG